MKVDPKGNWAWKLFVSPFFLVDAFIETAILMNSEQYKAENVYDGNSVEIPNSAFFNNPLAQIIYSNYLYKNVKKEDGSNFFNGDPYDIVGEWQAHNLAFWGPKSVAGIGVIGGDPISTMVGILVDSKISDNAQDVNLGRNINEDKRFFVRLFSKILKWVNKFFFEM